MSNLVLHQVSTKLPNERISNREFCFLIPESHRPTELTPDTADQWIFDRTGISQRRVVSRNHVGKRSSLIHDEFDLVLDCLEKFQITENDWNALDAIVVVKSTPLQYAPSLSQKIVKKYSSQFGTRKVFTLEIFQPSTGFLAALKTLQNFPFRNAWIITSEIITPFINLKDVGTSILFGDGVAAAWLTREKLSGSHIRFAVKDVEFESMPDSGNVLGFMDTNESGYMKGPELFRKVIPEFKRASLRILEKNQLQVSDIAYYLPHQANARIIERAASSIGFEKHQIVSNIQEVGNTGSASMLIALDRILQDRAHYRDAWKPGTKVLMNACGAGLSAGAAILEVTP